MDHQSFIRELETFRNCQFLYLSESRRIEELVQSYLESPELHSIDDNTQLLSYLIHAEYAPLQRFTRTGLQPDGFLVRRFPQVGPWIVYIGIIIMWTLSIIGALILRGSVRQSIGAWSFVVLMTGFIVYYLRGWLRLKAITDEVRGLFDREIRPGHFDPIAVGNRLLVLQQKGLKVHHNVFALLQLQQRLQSLPTGADPIPS